MLIFVSADILKYFHIFLENRIDILWKLSPNVKCLLEENKHIINMLSAENEREC